MFTRRRRFTAFPRLLARFRRAKEGVTAIEFAFIAPVLLLMVMGAVEVSLIMLAQNIMENATFNASRLGKTGYVGTDKTQMETILEALNDTAGSLLDTSQITITSVAYPQFGDIGQSEPFTDVNGNGIRDPGENYTDSNGNGVYDEDMGATGPGAAGEIVVYTVSYPWPMFTPIVSNFFSSDGIVNISARSVVKNEPY